MPLSDEIFPFTIMELLKYASFGIGYIYKPSISLEDFMSESSAIHISDSNVLRKAYLPLASKIVDLLVELFKNAESERKITENSSHPFFLFQFH